MSTHVAIYTAELDGRRRLHRHFLRSPDGAVLELFGDVSSALSGRFRPMARAIEAMRGGGGGGGDEGGSGKKSSDRFFGAVK